MLESRCHQKHVDPRDEIQSFLLHFNYDLDCVDGLATGWAIGGSNPSRGKDIFLFSNNIHMGFLDPPSFSVDNEFLYWR